jgi:hypothetical protein
MRTILRQSRDDKNDKEAGVKRAVSRNGRTSKRPSRRQSLQRIRHRHGRGVGAGES